MALSIDNTCDKRITGITYAMKCRVSCIHAVSCTNQSKIFDNNYLWNTCRLTSHGLQKTSGRGGFEVEVDCMRGCDQRLPRHTPPAMQPSSASEGAPGTTINWFWRMGIASPARPLNSMHSPLPLPRLSSMCSAGMSVCLALPNRALRVDQLNGCSTIRPGPS